MSERKKQKSVVFSEPQLKFFEGESKKLGISLPDLIRRIIDEYRKSK